MARTGNPRGEARAMDAGEEPLHDHGDTRPDWPASPAWIPPRPDCGDGGADAACDDPLRRAAPVLHEWLTLRGLGGKQRTTGTILIFAEDGKWKGCVNDRDGGFYAFLSSDSLQGLLEALERGLAKGGIDWRKSKAKR